jgi:hypothetical protein
MGPDRVTTSSIAAGNPLAGAKNRQTPPTQSGVVNLPFHIPDGQMIPNMPHALAGSEYDYGDTDDREF